MHVFLSWSKPRSHDFAKLLYEWLPSVIQAIKPWLSSEIDKGKPWLGEIKGALAETGFCILCVTPENQTEPWLMFEGGAAALRFGEPGVAPLLFGFPPSSLTGPLAQFQATRFEKGEVQKLLRSINSRLGNSALPDTKLEAAFERWWPDLDKQVAAIAPTERATPEPSERDLLHEILSAVRAIYRHTAPSTIDLNTATEQVLGALTPEQARILRKRFGTRPANPMQVRSFLKHLNSKTSVAEDAKPPMNDNSEED